MSSGPLQNLKQALRQHGLVRFMEQYARDFLYLPDYPIGRFDRVSD